MRWRAEQIDAAGQLPDGDGLHARKRRGQAVCVDIDSEFVSRRRTPCQLCKEAPREVLRCLPGVTDQIADTIVTQRGQSYFGQSDTSWANAALGEAAAQATPWITGQSYQFSADIVAASPDGRAFRRVRIVVDASDATSTLPKIVHRQDLTEGGWPIDRGILDEMRAGRWRPTGR